MENKYNDQGGLSLDEIRAKALDKNTSEDELIEILADTLVEGFIWLHENNPEEFKKLIDKKE